MVTLTYYPGCSLKTGSKFYETSIQKVFSTYDIELRELPTGRVAAHRPPIRSMRSLPTCSSARNLALAEKEELTFFAPCSACYSRSKITNDTITRRLRPAGQG